MHEFALGWNAWEEAPTRSRVSGLYTAPPDFEEADMPPSFLLAKYHLFPKDQGPVGTCYANAGCSAFETQTAAEADHGKSWDAVPLSRQFISYWATQVMQPGRNPADGGTISATFASMADPPEGRGACHESAWPYKPNRQDLARHPDAQAMDDGGHNRLHQIADIGWNPETTKRSIAALHVPEIGIEWPENWTSRGETWNSRIGQRSGGHAVFLLGWHTDERGQLWWLIGNSHGSIYPPAQIEVEGYSGPSLRYCLFASDDALGNLMSGDAECQIAAGMDGFRRTPCWTWDQIA